MAHLEVSDEIQRPNFSGINKLPRRAISHLGNYEGAKKCAARSLQSDDPDAELCQKRTSNGVGRKMPSRPSLLAFDGGICSRSALTSDARTFSFTPTTCHKQ